VKNFEPMLMLGWVEWRQPEEKRRLRTQKK
jgi:hypothetical protein